MRKTLKVSLDIGATETAKVTISEDPAVMKGKKARWEKDDDTPNDFKFAGIELNDEYWPEQKILVDKNTIICGNKDSKDKFEYVIYVIHEGKVYDSINRSLDAAGDKPVIRND